MTTAYRTVEISGVTYRTGKLSAKKQFHIARKLAPLLASFADSGLLKSKPKDADELLSLLAGPMAHALSEMKTEDADFVIDSCLEVVQRRQMVGQHETWPLVFVSGTIMFHDIDMPAMMNLTINVLRDNLGSFFPTTPPKPAGEEKTVVEIGHP
jgi:hypothetical protein